MAFSAAILTGGSHDGGKTFIQADRIDDDQFTIQIRD